MRAAVVSEVGFSPETVTDVIVENPSADADGLTIALSASGTSGMEAGLASLVEPGDTAIIGSCGFFGNRMIEIARRQGVNVIEVRAPFGEAASNDRILEQLGRHPETRLVAVVHAETSTGVAHPVAELAAPPGLAPGAVWRAVSGG